MNVPDVTNPDVLTPGTPALLLHSRTQACHVSHCEHSAPKTRDSQTSQASRHSLLIGVLWGCLVMVCDSLTKCTWSIRCQSRGESCFYSGQRVDHEAGPCAQMIRSKKAHFPAAVFVITCPYMVQLIRHSPPSPSSPSNNPTRLLERPINNKGARALIPSENGHPVPFTPAPTLKSYSS